MSEWIESSSGVKFLCWGELKKEVDNPDDFVVVKMGEKIQGVIESYDFSRDDDGNISEGKFKLKTKEYEEPLLVWLNASMKRQVDELKLDMGDEIQLLYQKDYKAKNGKIGKDVKIRKKVK